MKLKDFSEDYDKLFQFLKTKPTLFDSHSIKWKSTIQLIKENFLHVSTSYLKLVQENANTTQFENANSLELINPKKRNLSLETIKTEKDLLSKVQYIIPFRESIPERRDALQFVLRWLHIHLPELEILIVEQDDRPKLDIQLPKNCKKLFLYNPNLFNKGWALNYAAKISKKAIFAFGDADAFMTRSDYIECFRLCLDVESVCSQIKDAHNVVVNSIQDLNYRVIDTRFIAIYAAMFFVVRNESFKKIAGWDERFEGWGCEDDMISILIKNKLSYQILDKITYHIDHKRLAKDSTISPLFNQNNNLKSILTTYQGRTFDQYIDQLKKSNLGDPSKYSIQKNDLILKAKFVLSTYTENSIETLKSFIADWNSTRSIDADWTLIILDNGSKDGTKEYIDSLKFDHTHIIFKTFDGLDKFELLNEKIRILSNLDFDVCFVANIHLSFNTKNWDNLYWQAINYVGYDCLVFFDKKVSKSIHTSVSQTIDQVVTHPITFNVSSFFTITPAMVKEVGYFDTISLPYSNYIMVDYLMRCSRAGFISSFYIFDIVNSEQFITSTETNTIKSQIETIDSEMENWKLVKIKDFISQNRLYIPYARLNVVKHKLQNYFSIVYKRRVGNKPLFIKNNLEQQYPKKVNKPSRSTHQAFQKNISLKPKGSQNRPNIKKMTNTVPGQINKTEPKNHINQIEQNKKIDSELYSSPQNEARAQQTVKKKMIPYQLVDSKYYRDRGLFGFIGSSIKKVYNFSIRRGWYFVPRNLTSIAKKMKEIGHHLDDIVSQND